MAKKSLGQNFLVDEGAIAEIIAAVPSGSDGILEIGPGKGALTFYLAKLTPKLFLLEKDEEILAGTRTRLKIEGHDDFLAWEGDALEFDFARVWKEGEFTGDLTVVSNLPYNVATEIMFRLLEHRSKVSSMVLMFQQEVANRISASSGTKAYGAISVITQIFYKIEHILKIGPESFRPRPKVDSGVLRFQRRAEPLIPVNQENWREFSDFMHICFRQRRKTLTNSLQHNWSLLPSKKGWDKAQVISILHSIGLKESQRAETLQIEDFFKLYQSLKAM